MDEDVNAQYALKIAVTTLRERCHHFQRRIAVLEEENMNLKQTCKKNEQDKDSLSQIDSLKQQIASLEEQNSQIQNKLMIVSQENQQLWTNLGKLTQTNKTLGSQLNKINDTLSEHGKQHQPLIRSKTFTQDKPQNDNIKGNNTNKQLPKLDLEDISLKLINSMSEIKTEVDSLVQDLNDVEIIDNDNVITSSLGFNFDDENDDIIEDLKIILDEFNHIKNESARQNLYLKECLENVKIMKRINSKCDNCIKNEASNNIQIVESSTDSLNVEENVTFNKIDKMCPICSQQFPQEYLFSDFVCHVEAHFKIK